jgi:hypothetical protein
VRLVDQTKAMRRGERLLQTPDFETFYSSVDRKGQPINLVVVSRDAVVLRRTVDVQLLKLGARWRCCGRGVFLHSACSRPTARGQTNPSKDSQNFIAA